MDLISNLGLGFAVALSATNLIFCFIGVFVGTLIGVLPGLGAIAAVSVLMPVTFHLEPTTALVMLAGIYYGAQYGGSTASILLNLPGTPASAITCLDGYPMAMQGRAGVALLVTTVASFVGSSLGIVALAAFAPALANVALAFGPADFFAVMLLGLMVSVTVAQGPPLNGLAMVCFGIVLGLAGADMETGTLRYTFGVEGLIDGLNLVAIAMGFFGIAEVIASIDEARTRGRPNRVRLADMLPTRDDVRRSMWPTLRGSAIGGLLGTLPGTGPTISSFISYSAEKKVARDPSRFGKGAIEGIASPEAANNAAAQTGFVPTLTMGIPGDAVMALMLGALMINGIIPGPALVTEHPGLFWGLVASFWIGNVLLLILNIPMIGLWVRLLQVPYQYLYPAIICLVCLGVYSVNNNAFDIVIVLVCGIAGYMLRLVNLEPAPLLLGFVLGPLMEENLRRALVIAQGDLTTFMQRPISGTILTLTAVSLAWTLWKSLRVQPESQQTI